MTFEFQKYIKFFHDGTLDGYTLKEGGVDFRIGSAELPPDEELGDVHLDRNRRLVGTLSVVEISRTFVDEKPLGYDLGEEYDDAGLDVLTIHGQQVFLEILWANYPPKASTSDFSRIGVEGKEITFTIGQNTYSLTGMKVSSDEIPRRGHWHHDNPQASCREDAFLDRSGNPCPIWSLRACMYAD